MKYTLLITLFLLVGCNSNNSEEKTIATLKNNTWIDNSCKIITQFDTNGTAHYQYFKSTYVFQDTYIHENISNYSDKNCTNSLNTDHNTTNLAYYDLGLKETKNNYNIHDIKFEISSGDGEDGYYAISHNKLCFSKLLYANNSYEEASIDNNGNPFTYNGSGFDIYSSSSRSKDIDYDNCLIKK